MKKTIILKTRPFQPLLLASEDLLKLAKPYFDQIQAHSAIYDSSGEITILPDGVWQTEKSLSIAAFLTKYAGLEALINSCLNDFAKRPAVELLDTHFVGPLAPLKNKLKKSKPENWRLSTRLFLSIPICSDPEVDPTSIFDIDSREWKQFEEVIDIRHAYAHANSVDVKLVLTKSGPKVSIADDSHPENFWPITKTPKDHRILNYEVAKNLNRIIDWVISKYRQALKRYLDDAYGSQEKAVIQDGGVLSLGQPNLPNITLKNTTNPVRSKQGRNEPCACGSGKKYKKCCGY